MKKISLFLIAFFVIAGCEDFCDCPDENTDIFCNIGGVKHYENTVSLDLYYMRLNELPDCIGNLTNLEYLNLNRNQLTALPESIGNLINMEVMSFMNNQLTSLPESIGNLTNLKELYLTGNNFSDTEKDKIEHWLPNCMIIWW